MKNAPLDLTAVAGSALAREVGQGACKELLVSSHMKSFFFNPACRNFDSAQEKVRI
jgi:hypothetical protein